MAIETIITMLAVMEAEIAGVVKAHDNVPAGVHEVPAFINYPKTGRLHFGGAGFAQSDHTIHCDLLYSKTITAEADKKLRPFIKLFRDKLASSIGLRGTASTINDIRYQFPVLVVVGGETFLGIHFEVDVKETETVTTGV